MAGAKLGFDGLEPLLVGIKPGFQHDLIPGQLDHGQGHLVGLHRVCILLQQFVKCRIGRQSSLLKRLPKSIVAFLLIANNSVFQLRLYTVSIDTKQPAENEP